MDIREKVKFLKEYFKFSEKLDCFAALITNEPGNTLSIMAGGTDWGHSKLQSVTTKFRFGFLTYDLKNQFESLSSKKYDGIGLPDKHFFSPINVQENKFSVERELGTIGKKSELKICTRTSKEEYLEKVKKIKGHIYQGDIYELNFCIEFYAENAVIDPVETYLKLNEISPMPFSCFYKFGNTYLLCASPERFLKKVGNRLISQPIKGTIRRGKNEYQDNELIETLKSSIKERSENIMIVDLVRNDLSKVAKRGTVKVDELCGIQSFKQVHQMVSTVSCELREEVTFEDIIKATFPMGSMTGAPKVKAMELIEEFENTKRGLYSGAVGYIKENGDFDFAVVIRSIIYNEKRKYLSFMVGSAITAQCDPAKEWEECLLKAKSMFEALGCLEQWGLMDKGC